MEKRYRNPFPTVDIIIEVEEGIVLVKRKNEPRGWAIPGGFVEYGETVEECALREAKEETSLDVELVEQFHVYSDPKRDPRFHTISTVFIAKAKGKPSPGDDAGEAKVFNEETLPEDIVFDHKKILADYFRYKKTGVRPK